MVIPFLGFNQPFIYKLVDTIIPFFSSIKPGIQNQSDFVSNVIKEEELSFLKTLQSGISKLDYYLNKTIQTPNRKCNY